MATGYSEDWLADSSPNLYNPATGDIAVFYTNSDYRDDLGDPGVRMMGGVEPQDMRDWYVKGDFLCADEMVDGPSCPRGLVESKDWPGYIHYKSEEYVQLVASIEHGGWVRLPDSDTEDQRSNLLDLLDQVILDREKRSIQ